MQYCINALLKNNNEIMRYCIINNDIALVMHYRALLQMPAYYYVYSLVNISVGMRMPDIMGLMFAVMSV